jgi:hopene-associated glycosyltransferase HpnB
MTETALGAIALAALLYLIFRHGSFWLADQRMGATAAPQRWPEVTAVVPARNEEALIGRAIASLRAQDYPDDFRIVVVDDESADRTAEAAVGVEVVRGEPRPPGWGGKLWAMEQGVRRAGDASFIWFTDADVVHAPDTLRRLVAKAESETLDLVSLMVRLDIRTTWDRLLIPAFVFFFQMLYPFPWVNDPKARTAGAAGGSMLVRTAVLARIGGIVAIKDRLIDDCALAAEIKRTSGRIWLGLSEDDVSIRPYAGLGGIWRMVSRTAYDQLGYSPGLLAGTIVWLVLLFVLPPILAFTGSPLGVAGWLAIAMAEIPTLRLYRLPPWWGLFLPLAALLYAGMTLDSARQYWRGRGGEWKGRTHRPAPDPG